MLTRDVHGRIQALKKRGLCESLAEQLWTACNFTTLAAIEALSDEQIADLSRIAEQRDAATEHLTNPTENAKES